MFGRKNAFFQNFKKYVFSVFTSERLPITFFRVYYSNERKNSTKESQTFLFNLYHFRQNFVNALDLGCHNFLPLASY